MRRFHALLASVALPLVGCAANPPIDEHEKPRLLVLIVADQMSDDLLDRQGGRLTGGFARLLRDGRRFEDAIVDHAPTNSLPGHLSAASGAYPRRHGVIDNSWAEIGFGGVEHVSGFGDPQCPIVSGAGRLTGEEAPKGLGPSRFESPTIVEWTLAAAADARFASIGLGGGVSALHAGKARGPVLWYDNQRGEFVTSACYGDRLPQWAVAVNAVLPESYMNADWTLSAPVAMLTELGPDKSPFENGGSDFSFPHSRPLQEGDRAQWFNFTPFADGAVLALASKAVEVEQLGADAQTDILTIGLSSLDHIGHRFGPTSVEQADALWRLDQALGDFFNFLDSSIGEDRWAVALTADHGAPPAPEDAARWGIKGARRISEEEAYAAIAKIARAADGAVGRQAKQSAAAAAASRIDFVSRVITEAELEAASDADPILRLYANSFRPGRTSLHPLYADPQGRSPADYGIIVIPKPYFVIDWAASIHGSPFDYDRNVELILMGPGIEAGVSDAPARTIDVAPTLAALARIHPTAPIDGRVLDLHDGR